MSSFQKNFPPLSAFATGVAVGIFVITLMLLPYIKDTNEKQLRDYGQALATMAASQAIDAAFNHDLVSLQVILRDVIAHPKTHIATIHDVENRLLVQAGANKTLSDKTGVFTAPIVLHDSIAGYVTVVLDTSTKLHAIITLISALGFAVIAIATWSLYQVKGKEIRSFFQNALPRSHDNQTKPYVSTTKEDQKQTSNLLDNEYVYAAIYVKNLAVLNQQLDGNTFRRTLAHMEKTINNVLALYNGMGFEFKEGYYLLRFLKTDNEVSEALFRALCSAHLVMELASIIHNIPLDLSAFVTADEDQISATPLQIAGLIIDAPATEGIIGDRVQFLELGTSDGHKIVSGFEMPFSNLLAKQNEQLQAVI